MSQKLSAKCKNKNNGAKVYFVKQMWTKCSVIQVQECFVFDNCFSEVCAKLVFPVSKTSANFSYHPGSSLLILANSSLKCLSLWITIPLTPRNVFIYSNPCSKHAYCADSIVFIQQLKTLSCNGFKETKKGNCNLINFVVFDQFR